MIAAFNESLLDYAGGREIEVTGKGVITKGIRADGALVADPVNLRLLVGPQRRPAQPPLVSCLMPTKGRFEQVQLSIGSYRRQTWPNRELIVLDQNSDGRLAAWIAGLNDPGIRVFTMPGLQEPLGSIRNRTIDLANGQLLCTWDDDDLHHPAYIEIAFASMAAARAAMCMLLRETLWLPARQRVGIRHPRPHCNTILVRRDAGLRYPPLPRVEDTPAIQELLRRLPGILIDLPELYLYVVHNENTSRAGFLEHVWQTSTDRSEGAAALPAMAQLARAFPVAEYAAAMKVQEPAQDIAAAGPT